MKLSSILLPFCMLATTLAATQQSAISPGIDVSELASSSSSISSTTSSATHSATPLARHPAVCHKSKEACITGTNSCSGHGSCYRKSSSGEGGREFQSPDCWACECKTTFGTRTQHWGGAACQKKDISADFALLAGTSILLLGAVTFGIGKLISVGQEDLPSVIAAGVGSAKAR